MELSMNHRKALLTDLKAAYKRKDVIKSCLESESAKNSLAVAEQHEVEDYLNNKMIETIESALIDIEIDY